MMVMESRRRSVVKALSWRVLALSITMSVTFAITGRPELAVAVGAVDTAIKLAAYYFHERAWSRSAFGIAAVDLTAKERSSDR